ncbi:MAG: GNAT family N-acetyltransferase [Thauera sp.]|jgi:GNAT superfamily N-acetyltransferase
MTANTELKLRPLAVGDLAAVTRLDATNGGESRTGFFERRLKAEKQGPEGYFSCVAERGGQVMGFLLGHFLDGEFGGQDRVAVLDAVGIDPAARRQGLARSMVADFDRVARGRGAGEMRTQAQWDRPGLVEFFSAAGFRLSPRIVLERPTEYVNF